MATSFSRRSFLKTSAAAGASLTIAFHLTGCGRRGEEAESGGELAPNAFVRIGPDGSVTVIAKHLEMGQGTYTGLATILAEELDADWKQVRVEGAPADASRYANLHWGGAQGTGGSSAMANSYDQLRDAGATARALLVAAAAAEWGVAPGGLTTAEGVVTDPATGKRADYGSLVARARTLPVPSEVPLKEPGAFRLIGHGVPRVDAPAKVTGTAVFTQDVRLPGMLTAVVAHPPRWGAKVKTFDAAKARAVPGVKDVVQIPNGVAVLAESFWPAKLGRDALSVEWDESAAFRLGTAELFASYREKAGTAGPVARNDGDAEAALARGKVVEATYEFPYLAHATMEPMNCVVRLSPDKCEIWNGEQMQTGDQAAIAGLTGLKAEQVHINMLYAGGSFGRRANPHADYLVEAVSIAQAIEGRAPVKLVWTREDDMGAGYFRPMYLHRLRGAVLGGKAVAWHQRIVGQSILTGTAFEGFMVKDGIDGSSVEGSSNSPYAVPNFRVEAHTMPVPVPVLWWRSVGHTHTGFAMEAFVDELATAAGRDPVDFRRELLANAPRHLRVLNLAAEKAGWGTRLPAGRARGVAVHESFGSVVAEVAEVSLVNGMPKVHRVVCAVDCGTAINPDVITMQMESGIAFGLSAALYGEITLKDGQVEQVNFDRYRCLRMADMPAVEVHIVQSTNPPTGVGEPGVPPIAPAVANALFQLTGRRVRRLPIVA